MHLFSVLNKVINSDAFIKITLHLYKKNDYFKNIN